MMKKYRTIMLLFAFACLLTGCHAAQTPEPTPGNVAIGNPWSDWGSLKEAETAAGFSLEIPETVADYTAVGYRTMNGAAKLLEVIYTDGGRKVTVRKAEGEGQDISGVYGHDVTETREWKNGQTLTVCRETETAGEGDSLSIQIAHGGASWSLFAPDGLSEAACDAFLAAVFE